MPSDLEDAIHAAVLSSFVLTDAQKEAGVSFEECLTTTGIPLNINNLVTEFKDRWLYENSVVHPINYRRFSGSCLLLMYKNLNVTNLWPTELLALLRTYAFSTSTSELNIRERVSPVKAPIQERAHVSFSSDFEYTEYLQELFNS